MGLDGIVVGSYPTKQRPFYPMINSTDDHLLEEMLRRNRDPAYSLGGAKKPAPLAGRSGIPAKYGVGRIPTKYGVGRILSASERGLEECGFRLD